MTGNNAARQGRPAISAGDHSVDEITPLHDNLLVRRLEEEEVTGLIIPPGVTQTADGRWVRKTDSGPRRGVVVRAGRGDKHVKGGKTHDGWARHDMAVRIGDVILYPRFESSHVMVQGEVFTFVHEGDVMAVLDK
jgi:co-chaperonin GroES (HSP10)